MEKGRATVNNALISQCASCGIEQADYLVETTGEALCHLCMTALDVRTATHQAWAQALPMGILLGIAIAVLLHWALPWLCEAFA